MALSTQWPPWIQEAQWTVQASDPNRKDLNDAERAAARQADQMSSKEVQHLLAGADVELVISRFGFPKPIGRLVAAAGLMNAPYWSRQQVNTWRAELEAFVDCLR